MSGYIGYRKVPTTGNAGGVWDLNSQAKAKKDAIWPIAVSSRLLLHLNGENNSTTFTDSSPDARTISTVGSPIISTAQSKFGGASLYLDGSSRLSVPFQSSELALTTSDATLELWFRPTTQSTTRGIIGQVNNDQNWQVYLTASNTVALGIAGVTEVTGGSISVNTWYHLAVVRHGAGTKVYINGTEIIYTSNDHFLSTNNNMLIGGHTYSGTPYNFTGYIDEVRVARLTAAYTGNFTPQEFEF